MHKKLSKKLSEKLKNCFENFEKSLITKKNFLVLLFLFVFLFVKFAILLNSVHAKKIEKISSQLKNKIENEANKIGKDLLSNWFSSEKTVNQNVIHPLTTKETPLYTLDKSKSGNAAFSCPSNKNAIIVEVQPSPTKDLSYILIKYDLNLNNVFESNEIKKIQGPISGVCANGFIKCSPGTWDNCKWYIWAVKNNTVSFQKVSPTELGGCYCINKSCTSHPFDFYKENVLETLGGGIVATVVKIKSRLKIAEGRIVNNSIIYAAQDNEQCQKIQNNQGLTFPSDIRPENLAKNPEQIIVEGQNLYKDQKNDPNSIANLVLNVDSPSYSLENECSIVRDFYPIKVEGCFYEGPFGGTTKIKYGKVIYNVGGKIIEVFGQGTSIAYRIWIKESKNTPEIFTIPVPENCKNIDVGSGFSLKICPNVNKIEITVTYSSTKKTHTFTMISEEDLSNSCKEFEKNEKCYLKEERVYNLKGNWIYTYKNFNPVDSNSLLSLPKTCKYGKCYEWWRKERIYICEEKREKIDDIDMTRIEHVGSTLKSSTSNFEYEDKIKKENKWTIISGTKTKTDLEQKEKDNTCVRMCRIMKWFDPAEATEEYTRADINKTTGHYKIIYRQCDESNKCPVDPTKREKQISKCECMEKHNKNNEFLRAATITEIMRLSSKDQICSSN